jgi:lysophospholipase L1-like esterase
LVKARLAAALLALFASPALAQEPMPPGDGMIEQPCPPQQGLGFNHPYIKANDWAWLCRFRDANAAAEQGAPRVVFIGDSITERWGRSDPAFFAGGHANRGIGGQTTPQMLLRFWQDVVALHPKAVHIMAGTNDLAGNTGPNRPEDFKNNLRAMVSLAKANGIAVIIASVPPADHFSWKPAIQPALRIAELNAWLKDFAQTNGLTYADYFAAMVDKGGAMNAELTKDGVHPTDPGYAVMRPIAERAIKQALIAPEHPTRKQR